MKFENFGKYTHLLYLIVYCFERTGLYNGMHLIENNFENLTPYYN